MKSAIISGLLVLAAFSAQAQTYFPKIDPGTQQMRDTDRGYILEQELRAETEKLAAAEVRLASAASGDRDRLTADIDRHKKNLTALKAEISRLGGSAPNAPVRLKAASAAAPMPQLTSKEEVPFWDVYRRDKAK